MKILLTILGIIGFLVTIPFSISFCNNYQVFKNGHIVNVVITGLPNPSIVRSDFLKFSMNGKIYDKRVLAGKNEYKIGDTIQLKYMEGYENYFLLPKRV